VTVLDSSLQTGGVVHATTSKGLSAIHNPNCPAVIWQRPDTKCRAWVDALPPEDLPRARLVLGPKAVREAVTSIASSLPDCAERAMLVDDVAHLADVFASVVQAPFLRLRLDAISTNACRKFHIDAVTARLICTYRGRGTQYRIGSDPNAIGEVPTGAPMILRGTRWPCEQPSDFLHRSPPIEGTGETRLVLVLDPVTEQDLDEGADGSRRLT